VFFSQIIFIGEALDALGRLKGLTKFVNIERNED
jgi:hypothetical protein